MSNLSLAKDRVLAASIRQGAGRLMLEKVETAHDVMHRLGFDQSKPWAVMGVIDRSGSMHEQYRNGTVQSLVERVLAFSVLVDDDGIVPIVFFNNQIVEKAVKLDNFHNYVRQERIDAHGGTDLTGALQSVARQTGNGDLVKLGGLFRSATPTVKQAKTPAFVVIVTDGKPNDTRSATDMIRRLSYRGVFIKFLYVGNQADGWAYLDGLDNDLPVGVPYEQGGRLVDNVNAKKIVDIDNMSDADFYELMLEEVNAWLPAANSAGLVK